MPHGLEELRALGVAEGVLASLDPEKSYGVWYYNRRTVKRWRDPITFANRTKTVEKPRSEWIAVPVPDVGVDRETVERARERIGGNARTSRAHDRVWELDGGILRCAGCSRRLVPRPNRSRRGGRMRYYYVCSDYASKQERCREVSYHRAERLEAEVARRLDSWFDDPDAITDLIAERLESEKAKLRLGDPESQARALSERLAKLDRMKANYRRQQAEDLMSMADLKAALADLESQRRAVEGELGKALDRQNHIDCLEADAKLALDFYAACASSGLENLEPEDRRDVYRRLKLKVTVAKDGSLAIEGEPGANWLPEGARPKDEARELDRAIQGLRNGNNARGLAPATPAKM
jgi:hypothetical protein